MFTFKQFLQEALKPSEYRPLVKKWDKKRYEKLFLDSGYNTDRKGYRIFLPITKSRSSRASTTQKEIEKFLDSERYELMDYKQGIAVKGNQKIKIGKLLNKKNQVDLLTKFNTDKNREGTKNEYMVVISRHPYDIGGMSTDRGWTSCMDLNDGRTYKKYVPLEIEAGSLIAYVTTLDDGDLKSPVGRVMIKPFVNILDPEQNQIHFGISARVYGTNVPGFLSAVKKWVKEVNEKNKLDKVAVLTVDKRTYTDDSIIGGKEKFVPGPDEKENEQIKAVQKDSSAIRFIETPSETVQMVAVQKNATAIRFIPTPSKKIQLAAVQKYGPAIRYIPKPSEAVQLAAVKQSGPAIQFIPKPSETVQMAAVQKYGPAIQFIPKPSEAVQLAAVKQNGDAIQHIPKPSEALQLAAVQQYVFAIRFIETPSEAVQLAAVKQNSSAIEFIEKPTENVKQLANR